MAAVNNALVGLQGQLGQALGQAAALGINVNALTGGGQPGAPGIATTPQAGVATTATATGGGADPAAALRPQSGTVVATSISGRQITIVKADDKYHLNPPTGMDEAIVLDGKPLRFDSKGVHVRNFEIEDRKPTSVELDRRQGIAAGIGNLSKVIAGRQERLKSLSEALAKDANELGSTNQVDIQRLVMEQQATEHLSNMNHKIYESVQNAIAPWLR